VSASQNKIRTTAEEEGEEVAAAVAVAVALLSLSLLPVGLEVCGIGK
jgi:hypothetical protein